MTSIERISNTPMERLQFRDFLGLKCGHDHFSKLRLGELQSMVSPADLGAINSAFAELKDRAKALRWVVRGLSAAKAIRKVKTDLEVGENARGYRRSEDHNRRGDPVRDAKAEFYD